MNEGLATAPSRPRANGTGGSRAPKAAVRLARRIVREVRRRGLGPGDKLISEEKMVARYGVARGTLREALRFLELQGALEMKTGPGGGPIVRRPGTRHLVSGLSLLFEFAGAPLRALFEARRAIEPATAGWAARRASDADLDALREALAEARARAGRQAAFGEALRRFHDRLAAASGNPVFAYLVPALRWIADEATDDDDESARQRILRSHAALLGAIEAGDADAAARAMERLLDGRQELLEADPLNTLDRPVAWSDVDR